MLTINMEFRKGILFLRLNGSLNKKNAKSLKNKVDELVKEKGVKFFVYNLSHLEEIDDLGINTIKDNYQQISCAKGEMVLCDISSSIKLCINGDHVLKHTNQIDDELSAFHKIKI